MLDSEIKPLPKKLYDKAVEVGFARISLDFQGGSDEGWLYVTCRSAGRETSKPEYDQFVKDIEDWAWSVYDYSGAGDGTDYGDNVTYDLVKGKVTTQEWYSQATFDSAKEMPVAVYDQTEQDD